MPFHSQSKRIQRVAQAQQMRLVGSAKGIFMFAIEAKFLKSINLNEIFLHIKLIYSDI